MYRVCGRLKKGPPQRYPHPNAQNPGHICDLCGKRDFLDVMNLSGEGSFSWIPQVGPTRDLTRGRREGQGQRKDVMLKQRLERERDLKTLHCCL